MKALHQGFKAQLLILTLLAVGGCVAPPYGPGYGNGPYGYEEQSVDITGDWALSTGGINRFSPTHEGYYVAPLRGRAVHYVEIGPNLYQDEGGPGTYELVEYDLLVWRSNNGKGQVIELYRQ